MSDDYLWDPLSGASVDPDVARLEDTLGALRYQGTAPAELPASRRRWNVRGLSLAAALLATVTLLALFAPRPVTEEQPAAGPAWLVTTLAGSPRIGDETFAGSGALAVGDWLVTDESSRARLDLPGIGAASGDVVVGEGSRLRLEVSLEQEHRLRLAEGRIEARIFAPPRIFFVETASATAVDYGCAYSLEVDDLGSGILEVTLGWVALEEGGRSSHVPRGARCTIRAGSGPGTPHFETASQALRDAITAFDFQNGAAAAVDIVCREAKTRDTLTLWHLLSRLEPAARPGVLDRLLELDEPPEGVTRDGILALDESMLEQWKDDLRHLWY